MKRTIYAFLVVISLISSAFAQSPAIKISTDEKAAASAITAKQLSDYLYFIASDAMEGRDTPSRGLDTTAEFIKMNLSRWGFKPAGDNGTFFQKIALRRDMIDAASTSVSLGNQAFSYGDDVARAGGSGAIAAPIVFVGNGWMIKSKDLNPYAGIDLKGKLVAVYGEGPISGRGLVPLPTGVTAADIPNAGRGTDWADPVTYARANGAAGVLVLPSKFLQENWSAIVANFGRGRTVVDKLVPATAAPQGAQAMPILFASPKLTNAIFDAEAGNPMSGYSSSFAVSPSKIFNFKMATKPDIAWTQNVVAIWEGSDPKLKNEMVAIGAHYDHVGVNPNAPGTDKIWNGADDDGSGTTAVLGIAEALAKAKKRPKRSVLFVWHCGEEKGLWGSEYFNKFPTVDIKSVIAQLNIDMIGRSLDPNNIIKCGQGKPCNEELSKKDEIYVIGKDMMSSTLAAVVDATNKGYMNLAYNTRYDDPKDPNRFFFRSDHYNYAVNGIPITFWFDGVHEDYHQASDSPDKIDYDKMEKVTRTIFLTLWELTDLKSRPKIDKELPKELTQR